MKYLPLVNFILRNGMGDLVFPRTQIKIDENTGIYHVERYAHISSALVFYCVSRDEAIIQVCFVRDLLIGYMVAIMENIGLGPHHEKTCRGTYVEASILLMSVLLAPPPVLTACLDIEVIRGY